MLGRIVTIPYLPLSAAMLGGIVRLQLDRIGKRVAENHGATLTYDDAAIEFIVSRCNDPDSGGRMIDNIITNTLLPELSRAFLNRTLIGEETAAVAVSAADGGFTYAWSDRNSDPAATRSSEVDTPMPDAHAAG